MATKANKTPPASGGYIAVEPVKVGGKRYAPGKRLPEMDDEQIEQLGAAIRPATGDDDKKDAAGGDDNGGGGDK